MCLRIKFSMLMLTDNLKKTQSQILLSTIKESVYSATHLHRPQPLQFLSTVSLTRRVH